MVVNKLLVVLTALFLTTSVFPKSRKAKRILSRNGCFSCHRIKQRVIGPAYRDVAARYRNDLRAKDKLFKKVRSGGRGNWGKTYMPAQKRITKSDLEYVLDYILKLKGGHSRCTKKSCPLPWGLNET